MIAIEQIEALTIGQQVQDAVNGATITVAFSGCTNTSNKPVYRVTINREEPVFKGGYDHYSVKTAYKSYRSFVKQAKEPR